ncbi:MAG: polysaccharide biosynthesis/export family protein [Bacteroidales bacterium]
MNLSIKYLLFILLTGQTLFFTSCLPKNKMMYIAKDSPDSSIDYSKFRSQKTIKPYDRLYIKILSLDEKTTRLFSDETRLYSILDMNLNSYEVSDSGYINFPFVGNIYVEGYSLTEAQAKIEKEIEDYLPSTSIKLRYAGNYITVLGEVSNPGNHLFFKERLSIFEALGHAGGVRDFGNKQEILLVRTDKTQTNYFTLDLTQKDIDKSSFYYLMPDDVIIVQPLNAKFRTLRNFQLESLILSSVTTMITVLYFFTRN